MFFRVFVLCFFRFFLVVFLLSFLSFFKSQRALVVTTSEDRTYTR